MKWAMESLTALLMTEQAWNDFGRFLNVGLNEFFYFYAGYGKIGQLHFNSHIHDGHNC